MTDMPKYYPSILIEEVNNRLAKGIHTVLLWTKYPQSLLVSPLYVMLSNRIVLIK